MTAWIDLMIRRSYWVMGIVIGLTVALMSQIGHLTFVVNSDNLMPESNHYVQSATTVLSGRLHWAYRIERAISMFDLLARW